MSSEDDHGRVEYVDIYRSIWVTWLPGRPYSPFLSREKRLTPATLSNLTPDSDTIFVTLDTNDVTYRVARREGNIRPVRFVDMGRADDPSSSMLADAKKALRSHLSKIGMGALPRAVVLPSATYESGGFATLARHAQSTGLKRFQMLGRGLAEPNEGVQRFVLPARWNLELGSPDPSGVPLSLHVRKDGIDFKLGGVRFDPVEGCSKDGPTVCSSELKPEDVEKVRVAAAQGELVAAEEGLREIVETYDWVGLYNQLVSVQTKVGEREPLYVEMDDEIRMAVLYRLADVSRYKLANAAGRCIDEATEEDLTRMKQCESLLLPQLTWLVER